MPSTPLSPDTQLQVNALKNCINTKINEFSRKGTRNKRGAVIAQVTFVISSLITPIFIGWKGENGNTINLLVNLGLISSAFAAACSGLQTFFDWKELWTNYKVSRNGLQTIIAELDYLSSYANISPQTMDDFFDRYKDICARMDENYKNLRMTDTHKNGAVENLNGGAAPPPPPPPPPPSNT